MVKQFIVLLAALVVLTGCGDNTVYESQFESVPTVHKLPSWLSSDVVVFENLGASEIGMDWAQINQEWAGVVALNVVTGAYDLVVLHGTQPSASRNAPCFVCVLADSIGSLGLVTDSGLQVVVEPETWSRRSHIAISDTKELLAWRSWGLDHNIGVWVYNIESNNYVFLGRGADPTWKPGADTVLYRADNGASQTWLVEYNYSTAVSDTLFEYPPEYSGRTFSYSPEGNQIAYFRRSLVAEDNGLWVVNLPDLEERQFNRHSGDGLSWSEQGIVYSSTCGDYDDEGCGVLWLLDPVTGEDRQLTSRLQFTW